MLATILLIIAGLLALGIILPVLVLIVYLLGMALIFRRAWKD